VASNEDIRHRWNGHKRNRRYAKLYRKESGCCARFTYIIGFGQEVDEVQGQSKLRMYAQMQESTFQIQELQEEMDRKYARMATNDSDEVKE
jgi:hypothetical protein